MWPPYREGGYLRPAADTNLVNTDAHKGASTNMRSAPKIKTEDSCPICLSLRGRMGNPIAPTQSHFPAWQAQTHTARVIVQKQDSGPFLGGVISSASEPEAGWQKWLPPTYPQGVWGVGPREEARYHPLGVPVRVYLCEGTFVDHDHSLPEDPHACNSRILRDPLCASHYCVKTQTVGSSLDLNSCSAPD